MKVLCNFLFYPSHESVMFSMVLLYHMPTQLSLSPSASLLPCTVVAADFADSECEASAKSGVVPDRLSYFD